MLGTDLVQKFQSAHEVIGMDLAEMDITDPHQCRERLEVVRPAVTICAAAMTAVDHCETHEREALLVNGSGPGFLAASAASVGSSLVHYSTDYIFDGRKRDPYLEDDEPNPLSAYGRSKLAGDENVRRNNPKHLILRTSWVFGPHGKNFIRTILDAGRNGGPLRVVHDQIGSPSYTRDLAAHTLMMVDAGCSGTFHLTNSGHCSWFELARCALDWGGMSKVEVFPITAAELGRPAARPANSVLANARLAREGFPMMRPWQQAVEEHVRLIK
jgi:dTDP-4-dehydrorhamnose reductase